MAESCVLRRILISTIAGLWNFLWPLRRKYWSTATRRSTFSGTCRFRSSHCPRMRSQCSSAFPGAKSSWVSTNRSTAYTPAPDSFSSQAMVSRQPAGFFGPSPSSAMMRSATAEPGLISCFAIVRPLAPRSPP